MKLLVTLILLLGSGTAGALVDPTPDLLGVYFDESADVHCLDWVAPYSIIDMYAVLTSPSVTAISGFEFGMETPPDIMRLSAQPLCNLFWDPVEGPCYVVGCGSPVEVGAATVLMWFRFLALNVGGIPVHFQVTGYQYPSLPGGEPALLLPDGSLLPLAVRGGPEGPTATIFEDCVVGDQPRAWDAVKSLYR